MARAASKGLDKRAESRARYLFREKASIQSKGWNAKHPQNGGDFLEENEIVGYFPNIGLGLDRPDFLLTVGSKPCVAVEAKNDRAKIDDSIREAIDYADQINKAKKYRVTIAIGFAGEADKGYAVKVRVLVGTAWKPLTSNGVELSAIPSRFEIERALANNNGTTSVSIPDQSEFIEAAKEMGSVLRHAAVEPSERPRVIGSLVAAMYAGEVDIAEKRSLKSVNDLSKKAIEGIADISAGKKKSLVDTLRLDSSAYKSLPVVIGRLVSILERLNIRAVLHTGVDFLGMFYEAFLRYGNDNNSLGIVFTPRHITHYCVELVGVDVSDKVIDVASGTGGFLVAAFDVMRQKALKSKNSKTILEAVRESLAGFDTNHQIWALASLNMFFRGDGKSHIEHGSSLTAASRKAVKGQFTRAFLNPPFSQENAPETDFIDASMEALVPGGVMVAVVISSVFAADETKRWREEFISKHTLLGMISLPDDLFYPTAAPTSIMIAKAHEPLAETSTVFMAKIMDDGFEKLKGKRVPKKGDAAQLLEVRDAFHKHMANTAYFSPLCTSLQASNISKGEEWSPENWLPQTDALGTASVNHEEEVLAELFRAASYFPQLTGCVFASFGQAWSKLPTLPYGKTEPLSYFFEIRNGKSSGEKGQTPGGSTPYISSGDSTNSIISLVEPNESEVFKEGGLTITAFGQAAIQPWPFVARGNGGSSVRVLEPKFRMSLRELIWFAGKINEQRWRYFYLRMAIKGRLAGPTFKISSPPKPLPDKGHTIKSKIDSFTSVLRKEAALW